MPIDKNRKIKEIQRKIDYKKNELKKVDSLFVRNKEKIRAKKFKIEQIKRELSKWEKEFQIHDHDLKDLDVYRVREERNIFKTKTEIKNLEAQIKKIQNEINRGLIHGL